MAETAYQTAVCQSCTAGRTSRRAGCSRHRRERFPGNKAGGRGRRTGSRICGPELENHSDRGGVRSAGSALDNRPAVLHSNGGYRRNRRDGIYQLRNEDSTRDYRFEPYDRLQAAGRTVDKANYTEVYAAPLAAGTTLEDIYRTFNVDHPADFKGHSLSVSDVVVLHQNGQNTAHYCDSVGFQQVPEFLRENPLRTAELSTEQNENMIDGVLNNAPSLGELEAKAKAGEQISLTDLAAAVKAEEKAPKAKKSRAAKPKKPSIRAQLDAAKKEQSKQTPPREKTKELEV